MEESTRRSTEQTNPESLSYKRVMEGPVHINNNATNPIAMTPEEIRKMGVDMGAKGGDRTIEITIAPDILTMVQALKDFHEAFDCTRNSVPTIPDETTALLRVKLLIGETSETVEAVANQDILEVLDGLIDTMYVTVGIAVSYGLADILMDAFILVHKNNMSKLGPDGKPVKDASGKVIKPEGYVPVDLRPLLDTAIDRKNPPQVFSDDSPTAKGSCESCADTFCLKRSQSDTVCKEFKDNRNYPVEPTPQKEVAQKVACCGNCAKRLQLKGCSRYIETHKDGCCIDHKFLSEGASK